MVIIVQLWMKRFTRSYSWLKIDDLLKKPRVNGGTRQDHSKVRMMNKMRQVQKQGKQDMSQSQIQRKRIQNINLMNKIDKSNGLMNCKKLSDLIILLDVRYANDNTEYLEILITKLAEFGSWQQIKINEEKVVELNEKVFKLKDLERLSPDSLLKFLAFWKKYHDVISFVQKQGNTSFKNNYFFPSMKRLHNLIMPSITTKIYTLYQSSIAFYFFTKIKIVSVQLKNALRAYLSQSIQLFNQSKIGKQNEHREHQIFNTCIVVCSSINHQNIKIQAEISLYYVAFRFFSQYILKNKHQISKIISKQSLIQVWKIMLNFDSFLLLRQTTGELLSQLSTVETISLILIGDVELYISTINQDIGTKNNGQFNESMFVLIAQALTKFQFYQWSDKLPQTKHLKEIVKFQYITTLKILNLKKITPNYICQKQKILFSPLIKNPINIVRFFKEYLFAIQLPKFSQTQIIIVKQHVKDVLMYLPYYSWDYYYGSNIFGQIVEQTLNIQEFILKVPIQIFYLQLDQLRVLKKDENCNRIISLCVWKEIFQRWIDYAEQKKLIFWKTYYSLAILSNHAKQNNLDFFNARKILYIYSNIDKTSQAIKENHSIKLQNFLNEGYMENRQKIYDLKFEDNKIIIMRIKLYGLINVFNQSLQKYLPQKMVKDLKQVFQRYTIQNLQNCFKILFLQNLCFEQPKTIIELRKNEGYHINLRRSYAANIDYVYLFIQLLALQQQKKSNSVSLSKTLAIFETRLNLQNFNRFSQVFQNFEHIISIDYFEWTLFLSKSLQSLYILWKLLNKVKIKERTQLLNKVKIQEKTQNLTYDLTKLAQKKLYKYQPKILNTIFEVVKIQQSKLESRRHLISSEKTKANQDIYSHEMVYLLLKMYARGRLTVPLQLQDIFLDFFHNIMNSQSFLTVNVDLHLISNFIFDLQSLSFFKDSDKFIQTTILNLNFLKNINRYQKQNTKHITDFYRIKTQQNDIQIKRVIAYIDTFTQKLYNSVFFVKNTLINDVFSIATFLRAPIQIYASKIDIILCNIDKIGSFKEPLKCTYVRRNMMLLINSFNPQTNCRFGISEQKQNKLRSVFNHLKLMLDRGIKQQFIRGIDERSAKLRIQMLQKAINRLKYVQQQKLQQNESDSSFEKVVKDTANYNSAKSKGKNNRQHLFWKRKQKVNFGKNIEK